MSEILLTVSRVRRAMPRNTDVMAVCDALEKALVARSSTVERLPLEPKVAGSKPAAPAKFDKKAYQREYMRKQRAKKAGKKGK